MSDNEYSVKYPQPPADAVTLFNIKKIAENAMFIFNNKKDKLFRLGTQANRGLTLSLLEHDSAINSDAAVCLIDIIECSWCTQNDKNWVRFFNSSHQYFDVEFQTIGELWHVQKQLTDTFNAKLFVRVNGKLIPESQSK